MTLLNECFFWCGNGILVKWEDIFIIEVKHNGYNLLSDGLAETIRNKYTHIYLYTSRGRKQI